jgi:hypothetical protein
MERPQVKKNCIPKSNNKMIPSWQWQLDPILVEKDKLSHENNQESAMETAVSPPPLFESISSEQPESSSFAHFEADIGTSLFPTASAFSNQEYNVEPMIMLLGAC